MLPHDILKHPTTVLTDAQRERFFADGALVMEDAVDAATVRDVRDAMDRAIDASRAVEDDRDGFILEPGHSRDAPRLRRLSSPVSHDPAFWDFAANSISADVAADVCGPDVKFWHSKLNFKWPAGGQVFDWHQDIQAWPHTDYSPVTVGLYLEDCGPEQGPLMAVRGSHEEPLFSMYDDAGNWVLRIPEDDLPKGWQDRVMELTGPAGSLVLLNCRVVHGSRRNDSPRMRPLLLNVYSSADSFPYVTNPIPSEHEGAIVRGQPSRWSCHDPRGCEMPPDWSAGYAGPWKHQGDSRDRAAG
jgi:ectoine hydroxylase-related dioxygenase (phytanoyl-CoA dioxygenase family)